LGVPKLPAHLPPQLADELPDGPGAYRYFGEDGALLYVGRSHSLRGRILSQLAAERPTSRDRKLSDQTRRVEWVATAGDLGAMLLEANWIKSQRPLFNRHPHSAADAATLRPAADLSGRVVARRFDEVDAADLKHCFGVFHSEKDARKALTEIAQAQHLCLKVLGLEDSEGSCFALQMGKCRGACVGKEPLIMHNMRTQLALSSLKIKSWPFPGRIAVHERHSSGFAADGSREADIHVLENWSYLGTARSEDELNTLSGAPSPGGFAVDVYRILMRYFSSHPQVRWHDLREQTLHS
jgi:DNA polymerase-3 subunit epsilon